MRCTRHRIDATSRQQRDLDLFKIETSTYPGHDPGAAMGQIHGLDETPWNVDLSVDELRDRHRPDGPFWNREFGAELGRTDRRVRGALDELMRERAIDRETTHIDAAQRWAVNGTADDPNDLRLPRRDEHETEADGKGFRIAERRYACILMSLGGPCGSCGSA